MRSKFVANYIKNDIILDRMWRVVPTRGAAKDLERLPQRIGTLYRELVDDLESEGPYPHGWDCKPLKGSDEIRIRLTREWRVIIQVVKPTLIVVKVAHRKDVYR